MRPVHFLPLIALIAPVHGQERVRPEARMREIAKSPASWENKTLAISGSATGVKQVGEQWIGKCDTLTVVFTQAAWDYLNTCMKTGIMAVYRGEVMKDPADGTFKLYLSRGLNPAR